MNKIKWTILATMAVLAGYMGSVFADTLAADWEVGARSADSAYWNAYNQRDAKTLNFYLAEDVEFYHDLGGATIGKDALAAMNVGMMASANRLRREAVPGTVSFFPMRKDGTIYGALVMGEHQFYVSAADKPEFLAGRAHFTHLMLLKNGAWKMARIVSYEHVDAKLKK